MTQMSIDQALQLAMQQHQQGNLQQAEALYRQVLNAMPNHAFALEQFGVLAMQVGRADVAADLFGRAAKGNPNSADLQYNLGLALASVGQIPPAIDAYRRAIAIKPDLVEAYNNLAVLMINTGNLDAAIESCRRAIALKPDLVEAHANLGSALRTKGLFTESIAAHRQVTVLRPQSADSWSGLGLALHSAGRLEEAAEAYQRAIVLNPTEADSLENLGSILHLRGQTAQAIPLLRKALATRPNEAASLSNLAAVLTETGQYDEAIELLRKAVAAKPEFVEAHDNLGLALRHKGRLEEALHSHQTAAKLRPGAFVTLRNIGQTYQLMGRTSEAVEAYRKAIAIKPDYVEAISSLGTALMELREVDAGTKAFREAIAIRPEYPLAHFNLSQALLLTGDWLEAWEEQEWRWRAPDLKLPRPNFSRPVWNGEDLKGRRILVHAEQGFGDALHFGRYLPLVAQRGGRVIFQCHPGVKRLFEPMQEIDQCVAFDSAVPEFDIHIPLMSLPGIFKTTLQNVPAAQGYLEADPELSKVWKDRIRPANERAFRVGLVWAGRGDQKNDRNRSMPLAALTPLGGVTGVEFFSLQKGEPASQLKASPPGLVIQDLSNDLSDFADTAAALDHLDLLISADTAPAHLAGALGKPVWVLAAFFADWRYMLNRSDNPWYASMRVFRQPRPGDWQTPVAEAVEKLRSASTSAT